MSRIGVTANCVITLHTSEKVQIAAKFSKEPGGYVRIQDYITAHRNFNGKMVEALYSGEDNVDILATGTFDGQQAVAQVFLEAGDSQLITSKSKGLAGFRILVNGNEVWTSDDDYPCDIGRIRMQAHEPLTPIATPVA